jgi:hypothetical protein
MVLAGCVSVALTLTKVTGGHRPEGVANDGEVASGVYEVSSRRCGA